MTAFFVLVIFSLPNADDCTVRRLRDTLKKTGLEDVILGCDDRNYTLPNNYILAGEFMAESPKQCRKILYKKFERVLQDIALPTGGQLAVGVCNRAEWTVRDILPSHAQNNSSYGLKMIKT